MKFNLHIWNDFRREAITMGYPILACKNPLNFRYEGMSNEELQIKINNITDILKTSDAYLDRCGLGAAKKSKRKRLCQW